MTKQSRDMHLLNLLDPALAQKWADRYASRMTAADRVERNEVETAGLPKSPITDRERAAIEALYSCRMLPGSYEKRFSRDMAAVAQSDTAEMTDGQRRYLWRLVYRFRRQIGEGSELVQEARKNSGQ